MLDKKGNRTPAHGAPAAEGQRQTRALGGVMHAFIPI